MVFISSAPVIDKKILSESYRTYPKSNSKKNVAHKISELSHHSKMPWQLNRNVEKKKKKFCK